MKRIRFIAPVEAVQGNLSGKQVLKYADHNNPAYEAPRGKRNYARNYRPSYIGAFVSGTGTKYFAVKTKSAVHLTNKSLQAMALQGGAGAMFAALIKDRTSVLFIQAELLYKNNGIDKKQTMRKFYTDLFRQMLAAKSASISVTDAVTGTVLTIQNPWVSTTTINLPVSNDVLVKFWDQLADDPITFTVDGRLGVAHNGDDFVRLINSGFNVLGLAITRGSGNEEYVTLDGKFLYNDDGGVDSAMTVESVNYTLGDEEP